MDQCTSGALSPDQERARLQRLWLQKQQEESVADPYGFQNVLSDVVHLSQYTGHALSGPWQEAWNRALGLLQQASDAESQRRVYWLATFGVSAGDMDPARKRAVLETAFELLPDPGHRHVIRSVLSLLAAKAGDLEAAERWLAGCDPAAGNLSLDSAYRAALTTILAVRQDWPAILTTIGARPGDVPVDIARERMLGFFRVHALEALGHAKEAGEQLPPLMASPAAPRILEALAYVRCCEATRTRLGMV